MTTQNHDAESIKSYVQMAMRQPLLEADQEIELIKAWQEQQNKRALDKIVRAHLRLVVTQTLKMRHYGVPLNDLMQEGNMALVAAANRFDCARAVRFSTYAQWWVRAYMQEYILKNWSIVRVGNTAAQKNLFFHLKQMKKELETAGERTLTRQDEQHIADKLHVGIKDVVSMNNRMSGGDYALSADMNDEGQSSRQDFLADTRPTPEENVMAHDLRTKRIHSIKSAMALLNEREQIIIEARCIAHKPLTLETLGGRLGISKERVRQLEGRAMDKMRDVLGRDTVCAVA
jgi:RNA polymerase sigma-32 factor